MLRRLMLTSHTENIRSMSNFPFFIVCILLSVLVTMIRAPVTIRREGVVVNYLYGKLKGVLVEFPLLQNQYESTPVEAFYGLEFSSVRGGEFRFMPPGIPLDKWDNHTKTGDVFRPPCPQNVLNMTALKTALPDGFVKRYEKIFHYIKVNREECLTLNLFRPTRRYKNETTPFPVMVFVHGESYDMGTGNAYDGSVLASFGKVIVVTVNYRLGVLGFLSTGDRNANGNQALLDLLAVLTWIKDNIGSFDGDPNRVTLFGHGHGAALVNFLMLSHVVSADTDLKFHRAILQSGSAFSSWATSFDPVACAQKLAGNVNCSEHLNKSIDLIQCLKNRTANELVTNAPIPPKYFSCFAPTLDNAAFFSEDSIEKLISRKSGLFSKIKVMFGVTKNEAYGYLKQKELENGISKFRKSQIIRTYVQNVYKYHRQKIFEILDHQYSEWDRMQDDKTRRDNIMELLSDGQYAAPLIKMALEHSQFTNSYLYSFGYSTQSESEQFPKYSSGIHGDELPYIFGAPLVDGVSPFPSKYKKNEKELSAFMMRMWTNFAKSGDPNYPMKTSVFEGRRYSGIDWPLFEKDKQMYLQIGRRTLSRDHYRGKQIALWTDLIPKINVEGSSKATKPDSAEHNLIDPKNMSTFDEPNRLLTHFRRIGPPFKFIQPINDDIKSSFHISYKNTSTPRSWNSKATTEDKYDDSSTAVNSVLDLRSANTVTKNSVPLSITVAIGCTLLFFNILIFAGVYYQRERIKKLKSGNSRTDIDDVNMTKQKDKREIQGAKVPETINLIPSADAQNKNPSSKLSGSDDLLYNQVSLPNSRNELSTDKYSYSPVPTSSSSPMHGHRHQRNAQPSFPKTTSPKQTGEFIRRPPDNQISSTNVTERSNNSKKVNSISKHNAMTVV